MGVETELLGIKNRYDGKEFRVIEREDGTIAVLAGDTVIVDSGVTPVTATPSGPGIANENGGVPFTSLPYDRIAVMNRDAYAVWSGMSSVPTQLATEQPLKYSGLDSAVVVADGITASAGSGNRALYIETTLPGPTTRMGCEFKFTGGTGGIDGAICLIPWKTQNAYPAIPATGIHFTLTKGRWSVDHFGPLLADKVNYGNGALVTALADDTYYTVEWAVLNDQLTMRLPDGQRIVLTQQKIIEHAGPYACWEIYRSDGVADSNCIVRRVWASSNDPLALPQLEMPGSPTFDLRERAVQITSGATVAIPGAAAEWLPAGTRLQLIPGPTGKCLVRMMASIANASTGQLIWTLNVQNTAGGTLQSPSRIVAPANAVGQIMLEAVIDLSGIQSWLAWKVHSTVAGGFMACESPRPAVMSSTPI